MKLQDLNQDIAAACETKPKVVAAVQKETFRRLREALAKGEKVQIAEFGAFSPKEIPAAGETPARTVVKFKLREEAQAAGRKERKQARREAAKAAEGEGAKEGADGRAEAAAAE
jgi:nucleoid DNA-binding protein